MPCERCPSGGARKRVGAVIERMHGVRFGQTQVWRILGALGLGPQKPEKRAVERDEVPCAAGNDALGPVLKKSPTRRPADCLCRRVRHQRAPDPGTHLGPQGVHAQHPVSLQLDARLGHRGPDAHQLPVPAARGQYQEGRDRPIP
ncbi:hypothetical protein B0E49_16505 [Polaromonas sp. C04]|nr:hypothetical protein B0E49_16505 [Polaromonas sp. C04]